MSGPDRERGLEWMSQSSLGSLFADAQEGEDLWEGRIIAKVRAGLIGESDVATVVDRFTLLERIGSGAMGEVFAAYDPKLDRRVALKLLNSGEVSAREEVTAEARSLARLSHPNVVVVHEIGLFEGRPYIAMECVEGRSLRRVLAEEQPSVKRTVSMFVEAGRGLAAAHDAGVIHRDFKPENVVVGDDGRVRVADFGLALRTDLDERAPPAPPAAGTPAYMAPEQVARLELTPAVDQFAFCVALWESLCGERPTRATRAGASSLPTRIRGALERGLSEDPADRWPSMVALLDELVEDPVARQRARGRRGLAVAALAGAGVTAWAWWAMAPTEVPCRGAAEQLESVWNPRRRAVIGDAMLATTLPFAARTWQTASSLVDDYTQKWAQGHRDACEATLVRRRMLRRRRVLSRHGQQHLRLLRCV